jgi:hypothetical protein
VTVLTSLGRALAVGRGRAQRITTVRHVHVGHAPLVFVPLKMAGEVGAPLAAMLGADRANPQLLVVAQPRNRDQRFAFAHLLGRRLLAEIMPRESLRRPAAAGGGERCSDAPQIWVPNQAGVEFVRMLGRSTRFRRTTGPVAVPANVPAMGKWLTFYVDRAQYPSSNLLMAATTALSQHWATGQSAVEDEHLGSLLAWIEPDHDAGGFATADVAEDPIEHPPAGPATDPTFDNAVLAPMIRRYHDNPHDGAARSRAQSEIETALHGQLIEAWQQVWQAIDLLREIPAGEHVAARWDNDLYSFTRASDWFAGGTGAQRKRDLAVEAARRLHDLERDHQMYDAQRAIDDPLVMAEARMAGEAFVALVTDAEPLRRTGPRKKAPRITVETSDPVRLSVGDDGLRDPARPRQKTEVLAIEELEGGRLQIVLELSEGMGRSLEPDPGTVPAVGEPVCYSPFTADFQRPPVLPRSEDTPWTHGGPPEPYVPTAEDAQEELS